jgi:hypothetical protein
MQVEEQVQELWSDFLNYASRLQHPAKLICMARRIWCPHGARDQPEWPAKETLLSIARSLEDSNDWQSSYCNHRNLMDGHTFQAVMGTNKWSMDREIHIFMQPSSTTSASCMTAVCMYVHEEGTGRSSDLYTFYGRDVHFLVNVERRLDQHRTVAMTAD